MPSNFFALCEGVAGHLPSDVRLGFRLSRRLVSLVCSKNSLVVIFLLCSRSGMSSSSFLLLFLCMRGPFDASNLGNKLMSSVELPICLLIADETTP